ncbi:MAG: PucR family transcriptional regulator [Solirubrobacterales bacterium]|nr:helix-turn-helix domain-containing protein [Solirubrobacterales bacterium]
MRELSTRMIEAVLDGDGLQGVAELAAAEAGGPVAIVLPPRGLVARAPGGGELNGLAEYAKVRLAETDAAAPDSIALERSIEAGGHLVGVVLLLEGETEDGDAPVLVDREEVLRAAALGALAEVAVADAREEAERKMRGGLIEELRSREIDADEATGKAGRLGCDLARGAIALVAAIESASPSHATALVEAEYEGSLAELVDGRLYAVLPGRGGDDAPERTLQAAGRIAARLRKHGRAAVSSFYPDPGELHRAIKEAELVLDVITRAPEIAEALDEGIAASGVYRLLFRALISDPDEVRSFYQDTVEPLVRYDNQYRSDLLGTLEEYLASDCNMNATARVIFAHRHTVAYRLDRVKELTGLDPQISEDRERLGLGIKAYRILAPALPR